MQSSRSTKQNWLLRLRTSHCPAHSATQLFCSTYHAHPSCFLHFTAGARCAQGGEPHGQPQKAQADWERARADRAESERDKARADQLSTAKDCNRLGLKASQEKDRADKAETRAKNAEGQLSGSRQIAEAAKLRADKLQEENAALKKQPIAVVVDEEEVDRRAKALAHQWDEEELDRLAVEKAWGLADARNSELAKDNTALRKQLATLQARANDNTQADFETANYCASLFRSAWDTCNPCSMGLWVIHDGKALRIKESYFDSRAERVQRTDEEHYAELERLTKGYYIQAVVVDPSAASFIETIRRHGKYLVIPANNDVLNGIRCVASLMQAGLVTIHESCTASRREFGLYSWDDKAKEDRVVKENDHAMDDIRYFCYTILAPLIRWADWRRK